MTELSILIPSRNEMFLKRTIDDILQHIEADTEIIAVLDGQWPIEPIPDHPRLTLIYHPTSVGQRAATNDAARIARGKYVMKLDAHCAISQGFDRIMLEDMQPDWTMTPMMRNLHAFDWVCQSCGERRYQGPSGPCKKCGGETVRDVVWITKSNPCTTAMRFDPTLHFQYWGGYKKRQQGDLVDTMSLIGACWMLERERYWDLNMCDEAHGSWGQMGTEISCKTHLTGGRLVVNKRTSFAHLFRTQGGDFGFPYPLGGSAVERAREYSRKLWLDNKWDKAIYPLSWLVEKFWPVQGWTDDDLMQLKIREMQVDRSGIYTIKNKESGKVYVGSATSIARRFSEHLRMLRRNDHDNPHLQNSWNKHGETAFLFNIERFCLESELVTFEQQYLDDYSRRVGQDLMYNISPSAGSQLGSKHTPETLERMSERQSGEGNGFYGRHHSEESIEKMRLAHLGQDAWNRGIPWSDEIKDKISKARSGCSSWNAGLTAETNESIRANADARRGKHIWANKEHPKGMVGKKHTDETKDKIRMAVSKTISHRPRDKQGHFT